VTGPPDGAKIERTFQLATDAMWAVDRMRRRLRDQVYPPENSAFWTDAMFFLIALCWLETAARRFGETSAGRSVREARQRFLREVPDLRAMRNVAEHAVDFALDEGRNRDIDRRGVLVGQLEYPRFEWNLQRPESGRGPYVLDVEAAVCAASRVYEAMKTTFHDVAPGS
jgi:hypothetical protein